MIKIFRKSRIDTQMDDFLPQNDGLRLITCSPFIGLVGLYNIQKEEEIAFLGSLVISYSLIDSIPFLVFDFGNGFILDTAIYNIETKDKMANSLNLFLVELNNKEVVETRVLGLDNAIIEALIKDTEKLNCSFEQFSLKVTDLQEQYTSVDLVLQRSILQEFKR